MTTRPIYPRHPEIDLLRSVAIMMMVTYHLAYDLRVFYGFDIDPFGGGWKILGRSTAILFLLLVGTSFVISWGRGRKPATGMDDENRSARDVRIARLYGKYVRRGALVLGCAAMVSAATYAADPRTYVRFGILHLIGTSIFLLPFFMRFRLWNALIGVAIIVLGLALRGTIGPTPLLLPFNVLPAGFSTVDYFPLLPWFGVILIGAAAGDLLYVRWTGWQRTAGGTRLEKRGRAHRTSLRNDWALGVVTWPGRHSLWIYVIHQPLLLLVLSILFGWPK